MSLGLADFVALRGVVQGGAGRDGALAAATAELVLTIDVITWVPEVTFGGGARWADDGVRGIGLATLGVRRYLSLEWSVGAWGGATYDGDRLRPVARFGAFRQL
jgi:hypothetical protein